ncbi:hypothetical protein BH09BAC1_BH09BAC1_05150 [soil metagenome]
MRLLSLLLILLFQLTSLLAQKHISHTPLRMIIPSAQLPDGVHTMHSNNNLDLAFFDGRYYVAFRTAPTHFASSKAHIYMVSCTDMLNWRLEQDVCLKADVREPRFLVMNGQLMLYFFEGGTKMLKFEPRHIWLSMKDSTDNWAISLVEGMDGFVPWRLKEHNGIAYLSAYYGKGLYQATHQGNLRLFTSSNGREWVPLHTKAQVTTPGAEEGEFEFDREGNLWATVRLEGTGAYIAYASRDSLHAWQLFPTKKKYDSACMFKHGDDIYLLSRRNLDGDFGKTARWIPYKISQKYNLIRYSVTAKVTALFKLNMITKEMDHVMDFPSTGDNAYPAIVKVSNDKYMMLNYSSDFTEGQKNWIRGQLGRTNIYLTEIEFR